MRCCRSWVGVLYMQNKRFIARSVGAYYFGAHPVYTTVCDSNSMGDFTF